MIEEKELDQIHFYKCCIVTWARGVTEQSVRYCSNNNITIQSHHLFWVSIWTLTWPLWNTNYLLNPSYWWFTCVCLFSDIVFFHFLWSFRWQASTQTFCCRISRYSFEFIVPLVAASRPGSEAAKSRLSPLCITVGLRFWCWCIVPLYPPIKVFFVSSVHKTLSFIVALHSLAQSSDLDDVCLRRVWWNKRYLKPIHLKLLCTTKPLLLWTLCTLCVSVRKQSLSGNVVIISCSEVLPLLCWITQKWLVLGVLAEPSGSGSHVLLLTFFSFD